MARGPDRSRDAGVSSVVGTVLMLGITLSVFAGFSLVVLDRLESEADVGARAELDVDGQDGRLLLLHRGGAALELDHGDLLLVVGGLTVERPLTDLSSQVADGASWHIGESLCLAGPQPPCLYGEGEVEDVRIVYAGELAFSGLVTSSGTTSVLTYVGTATPTTGTVASFAAAQTVADSGAEAALLEGGTTTPGGTAGPTKFGGTPASGGGAVTPANVAASDDARAQMDTTGDFIEVSGLDLPANAATITAVTIGYEGQKDSSGGTSPTTRLDYKLGSGTYSTGAAITESATADTDRTRSLCTTQATCTSASLSVTGVESMTVRVFHVTDTNRNPLIDHVFVTVTYTTAAVTTYALDVQMDFAGVPTAGAHLLELSYRVSGEQFRLQVWDGASFVTRGATLDATSAATWSYGLTTAEYNGGAPRLRFLDATPGATVQGTLFLGHVRVVSTS